MQQEWLYGLGGGLLIGLAAAMFLLINGRVMGISGIVGGLVDRSGSSNWVERTAFIVGLVAMPLLLLPLFPDRATHITANYALIVAGGLLVGVGTRLANGCTSGHGVCGVSRLSPRGIMATLFYVGAGAATMAVLRHALGWI